MVRTTSPGYSGPLAPHAALLIDFDNVTMGIRSDLTKELKNLLNSAIIKGKVAVQRAYADWRRYPQYIVPLSENSVDLIFAPAYGSSKKNATDIRLAIDALELVFTRPEIGTFILLSGDSDFSSLVLKLKEYGKYVIGVGIRESTSDLLVQNCDEYYSYSALTGLTRAGDETPTVRHDPWELVEVAVRQMADEGDVMRSDRLKQVMLELDPSFDESALGFGKFNKFVHEAADRGLLSLRKMENGQFEVGLPEAAAAAPEVREPREAREPRRERGRRGRREERPVEAAPVPEAPRAAREERPREEPVREEEAERPREAAPRFERAARAREVPAERLAEVPAERAPEPAREAGPAEVSGDGRGALRAAYALLRRAVKDVAGGGGERVRDSDVKRRMLELEPDWDESSLGFAKFSRFLRQAHDAEVVNLHKAENGSYEVELGGGFREEAPPARERAEAPRRAERPERGARAERGRPAEAPQEVVVELPAPAPAPVAAERVVPERRPEPAPAAAEAAPAPPEARAAAPAAAVPPAAAPAAAPVRHPARLGMRGGARGGRAVGGPPPLLPGQVLGGAPAPPAPAARAPEAGAPEPAAAEAAVQPERVEAAPPAEEAGRRGRRGGRGRGRKRGGEGAAAEAAPTEAPAEVVEPAPEPEIRPEPEAEVQPMAAEAAPVPAPRAARARGRGRAAPVAVPAAGGTRDFAEALGLPTEREPVIQYLVGRYKGVGQKTAESLVDALGAGSVFTTLQHEPNKVRDLVGGRRAGTILDAWAADYAQRSSAAESGNGAGAAPAAGTEEGRPRGRGRRGGRRGGRGRRAGTPTE
ncbi:MAG TPA: NYN domain-containing protein [Longimicrobiales bacterium]|nr:NYN domain-containing protein [Longimicrobiales bacterium]